MTITSHSIKEQNIVSVFRSIEKSDGETRNDISADTGLSVVTVCKMVDLLMENNLLIEEKNLSSAVGRKAYSLRVNFKAKTILILDITQKCFSSRLLYLDHEEAVVRLHYTYDEELSFKSNLTNFLEQVQTYVLCGNRFDGAGISVISPGPYNKKEDKVINKRLSELSDIKLKELMEWYFPDQYIVIEEDVKFAGLYSAVFHEMHKSGTVFYAYIDEGVGGSIVRNGKIELGAHSFAGDFGQMISSGGRTVEEDISVSNFFEMIGIPYPREERADLIFSDLILNSPKVHQKIIELEIKVALAIYNVCWIVDPDYIVIESKYCNCFPDFIVHVSKEVERLFGETWGDIPRIAASGETVQYAYKGAASIILNQHLIKL